MTIIQTEGFDDIRKLTDSWLITSEERKIILNTKGLQTYLSTFPHLAVPDAGYELVRIFFIKCSEY